MRNRGVSSLLLCLVTALAFAAFVAAPAFAHHKDGHGTSEESTSEESTNEEQSSDDSGEGWRTTSGTREPEPDPEPSQAPPADKGDLDCGDYNQRDDGPYDHDSCDGSQGMHGSGGNGKCAGCTGLADDKSPGGQSRNDHNNGYECDNNGGVGKGNPAHARCPKPPTTTEVCPEDSDLAGRPPGPNGCDVEKRVDKVCPPGTDRAGEDMTKLKDCDDSVLPKVITRDVTPVSPRDVVRGSVLPFTGAGAVTTFAALGMLLIALGGLSLRTHKNNS